MIPAATIEIILRETRIEEVIKDFVDLRMRGVNYIGLCPFHKETTPSFTISPIKGIFKCFGCGKGGNVLNFLMEYKDFSQPDALKYLIEKFKITFQDIVIDESKKQIEKSPKHNLSELLGEEIDNFNQNASSVFRLMKFDTIVLEFCIQNIEKLNDRIKNNNEIRITVPSLTADSTLLALKSIYNHESMKIQYDTIYNQCLVLLVSYFSSSAKELFKKTVQYLIDKEVPFLGGLKGDIKLTFEDLENSKFDLKNCMVDILIDKKNISFQDMKSIARAFHDYFNILIEQTVVVDNIIFALASRHAIVHNLSQSDQKFMTQIESTEKRKLKTDIKLYDPLEFKPTEIELINKSMVKYLIDLKTQIINKFE